MDFSSSLQFDLLESMILAPPSDLSKQALTMPSELGIEA
jgi:hypothetical protein